MRITTKLAVGLAAVATAAFTFARWHTRSPDPDRAGDSSPSTETDSGWAEP